MTYEDTNSVNANYINLSQTLMLKKCFIHQKSNLDCKNLSAKDISIKILGAEINASISYVSSLLLKMFHGDHSNVSHIGKG